MYCVLFCARVSLLCLAKAMVQESASAGEVSHVVEREGSPLSVGTCVTSEMRERAGGCIDGVGLQRERERERERRDKEHGKIHVYRYEQKDREIGRRGWVEYIERCSSSRCLLEDHSTVCRNAH